MKHKLISRPAKLAEISFDELYRDISKDWQGRAKRLQMRRWHMLRNKMRNNSGRLNKPLAPKPVH